MHVFSVWHTGNDPTIDNIYSLNRDEKLKFSPIAQCTRDVTTVGTMRVVFFTRTSVCVCDNSSSSGGTALSGHVLGR